MAHKSIQHVTHTRTHHTPITYTLHAQIAQINHKNQSSIESNLTHSHTNHTHVTRANQIIKINLQSNQILHIHTPITHIHTPITHTSHAQINHKTQSSIESNLTHSHTNHTHVTRANQS